MDRDKSTFLQEFIAGKLGGLVGICTVYPLDTAKIRLQTSNKYTSTFDVIKKMVQADGVKSLYRGIPSPAFGFGFTFAISFSTYGHTCRSISDYKGLQVGDRLSLSDLFIAGAVTGLVQSPARQVVERVKSVMQVHERTDGKVPYRWTGSCAAELIRKHGIVNGLFQGMGSVLLREIPQFAVYYPCYELTKLSLSSVIQNEILVQFLSGGIAGTVQWLPPIYCTDVIKSRMQTAPPGFYKGIIDCASRIYAEEGFRVFFRGFSPAMMRAFPLHAIIFVVYENTLSFLKK